MKLCIFGSRSISPTISEIVNAYTAAYLNDKFPLRGEVTAIVSGMAKGADTAAITFARYINKPVEQMPANWKEHGRAAGFIRNGQMADLADYFIGFWDGESRGTAQMMRCVALRKKPLHMVVRRKQSFVPFVAIDGTDV
jgi:hypothetical protein